jgi:hypothetical protein
LREGKKVIGAQSRQDEKVSGSHTERTTISLRPAILRGRSLRPARRGGPLREKKKKESTEADCLGAQSREGAKKGYFTFSVSLPQVGGPEFLCVSAPLREKKRIHRGGYLVQVQETNF